VNVSLAVIGLVVAAGQAAFANAYTASGPPPLATTEYVLSCVNVGIALPMSTILAGVDGGRHDVMEECISV
jgi:hypothetical protein